MIWNFKRWSRKNHVEYSEVLVFGLKISEGSNTVLCNFYGWSLVLFLNFKTFAGVTPKPKNSWGFSKNVCLQPPTAFVFLWNIPLWYWLNRGEYPFMGGKTLLFSHIQIMFVVNILSKMGWENPHSCSIF